MDGHPPHGDRIPLTGRLTTRTARRPVHVAGRGTRRPRVADGMRLVRCEQDRGLAGRGPAFSTSAHRRSVRPRTSRDLGPYFRWPPTPPPRRDTRDRSAASFRAHGCENRLICRGFAPVAADSVIFGRFSRPTVGPRSVVSAGEKCSRGLKKFSSGRRSRRCTY